MKNINNLKLGFVFLFLIFLGNKSFSQTTKAHFVILNGGSAENTERYYNAVKNFDFEQYRFVDKRRVIKFTNTEVKIELFSARELLDLYHREIHPSNIKNNIADKEIEFYYFPESGQAKLNEISKK
jgi:hypothetical protein